LVLTVEEAARRLDIGRTLMFFLVANGEVESILIGRLRRIPTEAVVEFLENRRRARIHAT
jgi:excisionase family DNA binding protein